MSLSWPASLTNRVALFHESIAALRGSYSWAEIAAALIMAGVVDQEMSGKALAETYRRACRAIASGRMPAGNYTLDMPKLVPKRTAPQAENENSKRQLASLDDRNPKKTSKDILKDIPHI
ncbi:hypothetical protein B1757_04730 [Acidithiobacillus marinus]|uniref:Uncharacterized protein n=1 Tax=Acidithiobacillus marinus TaxID=187490 RepID=A0A2I1DND1_9PROT|nr:hypothetical protein [Acidithiobacillus marinus]PKY11377.1 hypothetical protein B1757_04730 [Acidithiobacillus marinus]